MPGRAALLLEKIEDSRKPPIFRAAVMPERPFLHAFETHRFPTPRTNDLRAAALLIYRQSTVPTFL